MVLPAGLAVQRPGLTWGQQTLLRCRVTEVSAKEGVCPSLAGASKLNAPRFALYHRWPCEAHAQASHQSFSRVASPLPMPCGHLHSTVGENLLQVSGTTPASPAPFVHASDKKTRLEFRAKYRSYFDAFRAGTRRLKACAAKFANMFPLWSFPPALPFNAPA
jgi:hypothetical protein